MRKPSVTHARLHRFHGLVALSLDDGPTEYLDTGLAYRLARELDRMLADIDARAFTASQYDTTEIGERSES